MSAINYFVTKFIGTKHEREMKHLWPEATRITAMEPEIQALSDAQLRMKTAEFQEKLAQGATLDDILHEAFAVVREAGRRTRNMRHFDVQLIGGMVLAPGKDRRNDNR